MSHYERTSDEKWMLNRWFIVPIVGPVSCENGSTLTQPLSHFTKNQFPFLCCQLGVDCPSKVSGEEMEQLMPKVMEVLARCDHPDIEVVWPLVDTMDAMDFVDMMEYRGLPTPHRGPIKRVQGMRHKLILHCLVRMQELFELEMDTRAGQMKRGLTHHVCCMDEIKKVVDQMKKWSAEGYIHVVAINAHGIIVNGEYIVEMHNAWTFDSIEFIKHYDGLCENCKTSSYRGEVSLKSIVDELATLGEPVILMVEACRLVDISSSIPSSLAHPNVAIIYACQAGVVYLMETVKDPFHHTVVQELTTTTVSIRETIEGLHNRALPTAFMDIHGEIQEARSPIDVEIHPDFPICS